MEPVAYPVDAPLKLFTDSLGKVFQPAHLALHTHSALQDKAQTRRVFILGAEDLPKHVLEQISDVRFRFR